MKTKHGYLLLAVGIVVATITLSARERNKGLVVHEWGTFTSFQAGDGELRDWRPLKTSQLPGFVYDWSKPDVGLGPASPLLFTGKGAMVTLQRMETPVVYFYSDKEQTVDLSVKFPQGFITEWYPRASQVGPSGVLTNHLADAAVVGTDSKESLIRWSNLQILPAAGHAKISSLFPNDTSGSHYFAARETDSDFVATEASKSKPQSQYEKFLFYRGVGDFATPLRVTMKSDDAVTLANTGKEILSHLFILGIKDKAGSFAYVPQLLPGEAKTFPVNPQALAAPDLTRSISKSMAQALVKSGLYQREAIAMVNTWKDSWFAEDGLRVLYVLPQTWTEHTLPMTLKPEPKELVRVMVGRAEILRPSALQSLVLALDETKQHGDAAATERLRTILRTMGRFAEPALNRALVWSKYRSDQNFRYAALALLNEQRGAN